MNPYFLLLVAAGTFGTGSSWNVDDPLPENHPSISRWMIKVLGNQGVIMKSRNLPAYTEAFAQVEFRYRLPVEFNNSMHMLMNFSSTLHLLSSNVMEVRGNNIGNVPRPRRVSNSDYNAPTSTRQAKCREGDNWIWIPNLHHTLTSHLPSIVPKLSSMGLELSIPLESGIDHVDGFLFYEFMEPSGAHCEILKMERETVLVFSMSLPIHKTRPSRMETRIIFPIQYITPGRVCAVRFPENYITGSSLFALVHNDTVFNLGGLLGRNHPNILDCDSIYYCQMTDEVREKYLVADPCLTAIIRNESLSVIHNHCQLDCHPPSWKEDGRFPGIVELGDKVVIYGAVRPLSLLCSNQSRNSVITPPQIGSLEMKMYCGCEIQYDGMMIWSSKYSTPPKCSNDTDNVPSVFQLLPSRLVMDNTSTIFMSELEQEVYFNISGNIIAKEVLRELLLNSEESWLVSWGLSRIAWTGFIVLVTSIGYETYMRRRPFVIPAAVGGGFFNPDIERRRG